LRRGQRKTAFVPLLSSEDVRDLYLSREPIERTAVDILTRQAHVPPEAELALEEMQRATVANNVATHSEADIALHRALVSATGSSRLRRMHELVMGETQLCIAQVRRNAGLDLAELTKAHRAILEGIASGDPERATAALLHDLHGCRDLLMAATARKAGVHRDHTV
jgi:DNA-binding GntR family transcriptional regulator